MSSKEIVKLKLIVSLFFYGLGAVILLSKYIPSDEKKSVQRKNTCSEKLETQCLAIDWPSFLDEGEKISDNLTRKNYYIVFDGSGSMAGSKCASGSTKETVAKRAVSQFIDQIDEQDNVGLFIFDGQGGSERIPLGIGNRDTLKNSIQRSSANGGTPLHTAIETGVRKLAGQAARQLEYGEYHLVIITDGEASGNEDPSRIVASALVKTPIIIHTVGFCINDEHSLNQPGKILYKSADNPKALSEGLASVLAESEDFVITDFE